MPESFEALIPYVSRAFNLREQDAVEAFRPATEADVSQILELRRAVNPDVWWDDARYVRWRYFDRRGPDGLVPYWVFAQAGAVVAACGLEPATLVIDGAPVPVVRTMDIMVHPQLDGRGLGAFMNLMLFRHFPITIVTGCNAASRHLISRMFEHTADLVFWKNVVLSQGLIERRYGGPFAGGLAKVVDGFLALRRRSREIRAPRGVEIRECARFEASVAELSRRCERPGRLLVRRDGEYLNWRFFDNPRCRYRAFAAFAGTRLDGYIVTRSNVDRPHHYGEGDVVDWLAAGSPDEASALLPALLNHAVHSLADEGAGVVTCASHGAGIEAAAEANGFRRRDAQRIPFFVKAADPQAHARLTAGGWYLTRADLDVE